MDTPQLKKASGGTESQHVAEDEKHLLYKVALRQQ
jgi:hypothetical protein